MNIKQLRQATITEKITTEERNTALYLKEITEGLTAEETAEQGQIEARLNDLDAILEELCTKKAPKLDAIRRALVTDNID